MRYRKLRIAWSVAWGVVAVLLLVLWVRTYQEIELARLFGHKLLVAKGEIQIDKSWSTVAVPTGHWHTAPGDTVDTLWKAREVQVNRETGYSFHCWSPTIALAGIAVVPWLRFSLRTLLFATTLVGLVLWLIVWAAK
jgi:hypothetical protein